MSDQFGPYPVKSRHRHPVVACLEVTLGTSPTVKDPTGVLDATTPVSYAATGVYTLNLRHDWAAIYPTVQLVDGTIDNSLQVTDITETAGSQSIEISGIDSGVADVLDGHTAKVVLHLHLSPDA